MNRSHHTGKEFEFTPTELKYLLATQRLVEKKVRGLNFDNNFPNGTHQATSSDVQKFGWDLEDAIEAKTTKIIIEKRMAYWLMSIWQNTDHSVVAATSPGGIINSIKADVEPMCSRIIDYYHGRTKEK